MVWRTAPVVVGCWLALVSLPIPSQADAAATSGGVVALDAGVLTQLNQIRASHRLAPLTPSRQLDAAAQEHSLEMIANGYFSHTSPDGSPFWQRIERLYGSAHERYWSVGENLFWSAGAVDAADALSAWMASPEHRANILNPAWRQIGIGALTSPDAPGSFRNVPVTVITADFGTRG